MQLICFVIQSAFTYETSFSEWNRSTYISKQTPDIPDDD